MTQPISEPARLGCVLAGGKSTRMGRDKATLIFRGQPLVAHAVERLRAAACEPVIAGSRPDLATYARLLPDLHPGCGPLGGIEAALSVAPYGSSVLFLPVDLPLLPPSFLALLLERSNHTGALATVPTFGGRPQPLCAVYNAALLPGISAALQAGEYKVMRVLESISAPHARDLFAVEAVLSAQSSLLQREQEPLYRWFANINTPQDFAELKVTHTNAMSS